MSQVDSAIDLLIQSRAANPRPWVAHFGLAAALGLNGDLDGAKAALVESLKLKPEVNSLTQFRALPSLGQSRNIGHFSRRRRRLVCAKPAFPTSERT